MMYQNFKFSTVNIGAGGFWGKCLPTIHEAISLLGTTLRHLGNRVTNIHRTVDRTSKHILVKA
jgi:hypothetical protein